MLVSAPVFRFFACVVAFLALCPASAQSQEQAAPTPVPPLQMALSSPFAFSAKPFAIEVKRGKWFPVAVTLSNSGDPVSGVVRLRLWAGNGTAFDTAPNDFYCPVDLPTNARKVVWLYGRLERPGVAGITVSLEGRGFSVPSQTVPIQEPEEGQRLVLTVSDNDIGLSSTLRTLRGTGFAAPTTNQSGYLGGSAMPGYNPNIPGGSTQGPIRPLETPRAGVPDRWFGLEQADLVVLGDFPHTALSPVQVEALRGYVAGGGTLVALGGSNAARLASSPLADLWPSAISSSTSAAGAEVAQIVRRYVPTPQNGADRLGGAPVVVTRGALKPNADLEIGTAAAPLFSSLDAGAGRAILLGFDPSQPPFVGWSGQVDLWRAVFNDLAGTRHLESTDPEFANMPSFGAPSYYAGGRAYNPYGNSNSDSAETPTGRLLGALSKAPQLRMPPVSQIAWFLALYVFVLVPLNYAVLRLLDRRELAWISIPVIVGAFSIFAYSAALSIRGSAILTRQIDVVQSSLGSKNARADSLLWLFSPKRTTYDVVSSVPNAAVADYSNEAGGKQGAFSLLQPADATSFKVDAANVWMWTDRAFSSQSLLDLKNGLTLSGTKLTNGTPFDLEGVVWVQDRAVRSVGALKSGASGAVPSAPTEKAMNVDLLAAIERASGVDTIFPSDANIPHGALEAALGAGFGLQNPGSYCIAWAKAPAAPLSIGVFGARSRDLTLMVFRVPRLAKTQLAAREAVVTRLASEPILSAPNSSFNPTPVYPRGLRYPGNSSSNGSIELFECALPAANRWVLEARGRGARRFTNVYGSPPGYPGSPGSATANARSATTSSSPTSQLLKFEVWNPTTNGWTPLSGRFRVDGNSQSGWNFSAPVAAPFARQPDRILRVRVRCLSPQTSVSTLTVHSGA